MYKSVIENSILDLNREIVFNDYQSAKKKNRESYIKGDVKYGSEYIYPNQIEDANIICNKFHKGEVRVISIVKKTKVGMDGLMIELAKHMSTHPDNDFIIHRDNIYFITGMSNKSWEDDMKKKIPSCFENNVFHHGKLQQLKNKLKNIKNALIIIDEIDCGDQEDQKLHKLLKKSGILDIKYMEENNIRFVFVSATMINELHDLFKWGNKHFTHFMTIPDNYIGHKEFLDLGIIKEYYQINDDESAEKWIKEDILDNYGSDFRVHIIRTDEKNKDFISNACIKNNIGFLNHTSDDRISTDDLSNIFNNITNHTVIAIKGFYRRANLIPNDWKKKIGATHEKCGNSYDTNVQIQGLPGRMSGYWKEDILNGHKTGPYRTSIDAIKEYDEFYKNPFGKNKYNTTKKKLFVNPACIQNLEVINPEDIINSYNRIPVIVNGLNKTDIIFNKINQKEKIEFILNLLNKPEHDRLYKFIKSEGVICSQLTKPDSSITSKNSSYKRHILDVVKASESKTPFSIDQKNKDKNNWQVFIDDKELRLCFVIWSIDTTLY
jgi:hypothetical protein